MSSESLNYVHRQILDELRRKPRPADWLLQQVDCAVLDFTEALIQLNQSQYVQKHNQRWMLTLAGHSLLRQLPGAGK